MEPIIASILFYVIVISFCEICRRCCDKYFAHSVSPLSYKMFLIEAIGALQVITCVYENQLIIQYYGLTGFAIVAFTLINVHRLTNRGCILSPAVVTERYFMGQMTIFEAFAVLLAELIGGTFGYRLAGLLWQLGLNDYHTVHYETFQCVLAYKTAMLMVAAYEFIAVLSIRLIIGNVSRHKPSLIPYTTSLSFSLLLTIGIASVGPVSLNPLVAYGRFGGCEGISNSDHLVTYWLAPISGWIVGCQIDSRSRRRIPKKRHLKKQ